MRPIDFFDTAVEAYSTRCAVVDGAVELSYGELAALSTRIAAVVNSFTCGEPLPIAICSPNDYRCVASTLGIMRAGAAVMPLHTSSGTQPTADYLTQLRPKAVLYHSSVSALIRAVRTSTNLQVPWICLDAKLEGDELLDGAIANCREYVDNWATPAANPQRPVFVRQTSGTTGVPKIVAGDIASFALSHLALQNRIAASVDETRPPVCLVAAPFSHAAGLHALAMLGLGATLVLLREFNVTDVLSNISRHRVTHMWLPASALNLILSCRDLSSYDCSSLKQILIGASAASPAKLKDAVSTLGPCVAIHYGQIESGFLTWLDEKTLAAAAAGDRPERLSSSGVTMHVGRIAIVDEEGSRLPPVHVGEIVVRSLTVKPYVKSLSESDATEMAASKKGGWHHTGDIGYIDSDGYLYVVGRKKDMVIMGGFKVPAAEVERVIMEIPEVADCAVIAVPDRLRGEAVKAIMTVRHGTTISAARVLAHCRSRLGAVKAPTSVEQWPELPRTPVGKIDKSQIRERFWATARNVN